MLKTLLNGALITAASLSLLATPVAAAPFVPAKPAVSAEAQAPVVNVRDHHRRGYHRDYRHRDRGFYRNGSVRWYNGHRGYRHHRRGYRQYNGYWFPPAAFGFGVIIGSGSARGGVRPGYTSPNHVAWCHNRYRSYREYDNSFQPYHGPRRACRSPYY